MASRVCNSVSTHWEQALVEFCYWKQAQGVSQRTLEDYRFHVRLLFSRHEHDLGSAELKVAVLDHMAEPVAPCTFNLRLQNLRAYFSWCVREGHLANNPLEGLKRRRSDPRIVDIDDDTMRRLLAMPDRKTFAGLRDYSALLLTLDTGLRPNEAFCLRCEDINHKGLEVTIRADVAKTRTSRTLPISPITAKTLRDLVQSRSPVWGPSVPLLCSSYGTTMNRFKWEQRLREYGKRLGVHIRPYDLRHYFALSYLRAGGNAFSLQRTLGHSDLSMTKRYIALSQDDLHAAHVLASPLTSLLPKTVRVRRIG